MSGWDFFVFVEVWLLVMFLCATADPPRPRWLLQAWEAIVEPFRRVEGWLRAHSRG